MRSPSCSSASTAPATSPAATTAASGSASTSPRRSWRRTTARSPWSVKRGRGRRSRLGCRCRRGAQRAPDAIESARFSGGLRLPRFRLIPREESFYAQFTAMADQIRGGARLLEEMFAPDPPIADKAFEIKEVEHKCDFITHEIIQRLNKTFVTPIDREDIHAMARALDDVMDAIDNAAALVPLYHIDSARPGVRELTRIVSASTEQIALAVQALE